MDWFTWPMNPSVDCTLTHRILFVGDDPLVLEDLSRMLHDDFALETACGCKAGLATVHLLGPFAIVIAHMRMSALNGVEFLDRVRALTPHTVGILLANSRDRKRARAAMNEDRVFRYLTTPCRKEVMVSAIRLGLARYRANLKAGELIKEARERSLYPASNANTHSAIIGL
jgi:DNA-binding NtrC family response regulator